MRVKRNREEPLFKGEWQGKQAGNIHEIEPALIASKAALVTRQKL